MSCSAPPKQAAEKRGRPKKRLKLRTFNTQQCHGASTLIVAGTQPDDVTPSKTACCKQKHSLPGGHRHFSAAHVRAVRALQLLIPLAWSRQRHDDREKDQVRFGKSPCSMLCGVCRAKAFHVPKTKPVTDIGQLLQGMPPAALPLAAARNRVHCA